MDTVLRVRNLYRSFRVEDQELAVLREVDLDLRPGEFVAVMGQSGSGKSSLLHVVAGLLPATSGQVFVTDREVTALPEPEKARLRRAVVGYVFQNFNLMPQLTAQENVELPSRVLGEDPSARAQRVRELMERMDVWKRRLHRPHQLSGGELQRVSVARALVMDPPLLLADEPTGNLASQAGQVVMELLAGAVSPRRAVLMVTHNPYDAAKAHRVLFLKDGRIDPSHELTGSAVHVDAVLDRLRSLGI